MSYVKRFKLTYEFAYLSRGEWCPSDDGEMRNSYLNSEVGRNNDYGVNYSSWMVGTDMVDFRKMDCFDWNFREASVYQGK